MELKLNKAHREQAHVEIKHIIAQEIATKENCILKGGGVIAIGSRGQKK